jgi:hypothetical protein
MTKRRVTAETRAADWRTFDVRSRFFLINRKATKTLSETQANCGVFAKIAPITGE